MIIAKPLQKHQFTPLRYPGGKTSLFRFFEKVIQENELEHVTYIEPYAGGVGAGLALLILNKVDRIVINDYDIAIFAFWHSILNQTDAFVSMIEQTPLTVEEWERQKQIYKAKDSKDLLTLGFATFYLNRTNRSGILNAGPIGGKAQLGQWKIDARYNKDKLIARIRLIATFRANITVLNQDGADVIQAYADDETSFFYVDPPYYVKGSQLYLNSFKHEHHERLAGVLNQNSRCRWVLTYDDVEQIRDLYANRRQDTFTLNYSAHHSSPKGSEIMVFSDDLRIPQAL